MKKLIVLTGILFAVGVVTYAIYHLMNELPPEGVSEDTQAMMVFEDAGCLSCHSGGNPFFDMRESMEQLKNGAALREPALAKIEYATVIQPTMPPAKYYLTHWGSTITPAKRLILSAWIASQRKRIHTHPAIMERFVNEPVSAMLDTFKIDSAKAALGKQWFSISCNACHNLNTGGADNRQYSQGVNRTLLKINTPTVFNACLNFRQFWDGRASDLAAQLKDHLSDTAIIANRLQDSIIEAMMEFEKTLVTPDNRFDHYLKGSLQSLNEAEVIGYNLFKSNKCATCHVGATLGGQSIEKLGIYGDYFRDRGWELNGKDLGAYNQTLNEADKYKFKVPGLRNVTQTKPYFHDGSQRTLYDAVQNMAKYQSGAKLSDEETKAILLFLNTL
ncbi:MAG: c-type cytochrome [Tannerella sp.]|jgi:cytochrome c peroxidase|nr:c-type cytochrome [Tannerella sp.]